MHWQPKSPDYCYEQARQCVEEARPVLEALSQRYPMMLVSNFYGNIDEGAARLLTCAATSRALSRALWWAYASPTPPLFRLGVDAL